MVYIPLESVPAGMRVELEAWVHHLDEFEQAVASRETAVAHREEIVRRREEALMRVDNERLGSGQQFGFLGTTYPQQQPSYRQQLVKPTIVAGDRLVGVGDSNRLLSARGGMASTRLADLQPSPSRGAPIRRQPSTYPRRDPTPPGYSVVKRAKRVKSVKDGKRPRRIAAYNLFKKVRLPEISARVGSWPEALKMVAAEWGALGDEEKAGWKAKADRANLERSTSAMVQAGENSETGGDDGEMEDGAEE